MNLLEKLRSRTYPILPLFLPFFTSYYTFKIPPTNTPLPRPELEIFRLEQRYTRRRQHRSLYQSGAQYVDGEYIYTSPQSTGGSVSGRGNGMRKSATSGVVEFTNWRATMNGRA
jgi:hypothetical protein